MRQPRTYYWILGTTSTLLLLGSVMVLSSSQIIAFEHHHDTFYYFWRHLLSIGLGLAGGYFAYRINYKKLNKIAPALMFATVGLLIVVFLPGAGKSAFGSTRWIPLGFMNLQPSELAKLSSILFAAYIIKLKKGHLANWNDYLPLTTIIVVAAMVLLQPDLGTAFLILISVFTCIFIVGARLDHLLTITVTGAFSGLFFIFSSSYRRQRFLGFLNPWQDPQGRGFQIIQSMLGLGSGGIFGVGLGLGKQKFLFLPAAYTDFIVATIGEELGLIGTIGLVVALAMFAFSGFVIASQTKDCYGKILASGITIMIIAQAIVNIAAAVGLLPITGVPLPLVSYGGSSMLFSLIGIGILLNIAKQTKLEARD
ncbi:MAG: putative lipid II flippase FtsW [Actinobacteria bacterium]|nr:MAG: putative lipid II flippase FtsW [Actinomycetota bacterium]